MQNKNTNNNIIPIFFSTDDNYVPFLDVAISSLIANASKDYKYKIIVLNTGLKKENTDKILRLKNETFDIEFANIKSKIERLMSKLPNIFHFGLAAWYRLFIESLFPQYDKVIYLDCDLVVLGDISKLYNLDMKDNMLAGAIEQFVYTTDVFRNYAQVCLGLDPANYINSGVLMMNLKEIRKNHLQERFTYVLEKYNFDTIAPDQDYLNFLCQGKIMYLPNGWNKTPLPVDCVGDLNIMHYALYKKPWQYDDVINGQYFWDYAKKSVFYDDILKAKENFDDVARAKKEKANVDIKNEAVRIAKLDKTFYKMLVTPNFEIPKALTAELMESCKERMGKFKHGEI